MNEPEPKQPTGLDPETEKLRQRMARLAWLLDNSIRIPIIGYRIGVDALLGLIPGVGDAAGALLSGYIFYSAFRMKAPASILARMGLNIIVELLFGMLPLLGDVFDATFKANARNMELVDGWLEQPKKASRRSRLLLGGLSGGVALVLLMGLVIGIAVLIYVGRRVLGAI